MGCDEAFLQLQMRFVIGEIDKSTCVSYFLKGHFYGKMAIRLQ